jgi:cob(I)alamin adenosyltransferase
MAKVTTGTGDDGYTNLLDGNRIPKYDPRPEVLGTIDEATSALGLARALTADVEIQALIVHLQRDLYAVMGEIATPKEHRDAVGIQVKAEQTQWLEKTEEDLKTRAEIPNKFVIPGDTADGAALDVARTIIRRAERLAAKLLHEGIIVNPEVIRYLNRCSDVVFILARVLEVRAGGSTLASK